MSTGIKISCIYEIKNIKNNNIYIGSTNNFKKRFLNHRLDLRKNKHHSKHLQNAWNKYGEENFEFNILLKCPIDYLIKMEQWFIDTLKPIYNCCKEAGRISIPRTAEWKEKIGNSNRGRKYTEEQKINMVQFGRNKKPVYKICPKSFEIISEYNSANQAAIMNNTLKSSILSCTNNKIILTGGYMYCRVSDYNIEQLQMKINNRYGNYLKI